MTLTGICHCGKTKSEVAEVPAAVRKCTCPHCSKRGALWAYYSPAQFKLAAPREEDLATCQWNSRTIKAHYCEVCGCVTFGVSPDWSTGAPDFDNPRIGVNARLFDDFDLDAVPVEVIDGKNLW